MTTPKHAFRIDDELWEAARARAASEGHDVSTIVREALRAYAGGQLNLTIIRKKVAK